MTPHFHNHGRAYTLSQLFTIKKSICNIFKGNSDRNVCKCKEGCSSRQYRLFIERLLGIEVAGNRSQPILFMKVELKSFPEKLNLSIL